MSLGPISFIAVLASCFVLGSAFYDYNEEYHTCRAWADPHYVTYDGATIHYQGTCRYLLTGTCPCSKVQHPFKVFVENEHYSGPYSITRIVDIEIYGYLVRFNANGVVELRDPLGIWISSLPVTPPYSFADAHISESGYVLTFTTDDGITVTFDRQGYRDARVTVPCKYRDELCGLCGNLNSVALDDYTTSDNTAVPNTQAGWDLIGDSWQVAPLATPVTLPDECYHEREGGLRRAEVIPADWNEYCEMMAGACRGAGAFYDSCLYEVGAQPDNERAHCDAVKMGLQECGPLPENWREEFNCPCPNGEFTEPCGPCWDGTYSDPCPRRPVCTGRFCVEEAAPLDAVRFEGK